VARGRGGEGSGWVGSGAVWVGGGGEGASVRGGVSEGVNDYLCFTSISLQRQLN
jgi:hypothetical protein